MNMMVLARRLGKIWARNSTKILTGINIIGGFLTTGLAVEATVKARDSLEDLKAQTGKELRDIPKKEIIKAVALHYIPTALSLVAQTAAGVGSATISNKRNAALAGLYSASELALKEYKDHVIDVIGDKKANAIEDKQAEAIVKAHPAVEGNITATGFGDQLCYDVWNDRYFTCSIEKIRRVQNDMNARIIGEMWVTFNEVYAEIGLKPVKLGDNIGWNVDHMIEFRFTSCIDDKDRACLVVDHRNRPVTLNNEEL